MRTGPIPNTLFPILVQGVYYLWFDSAQFQSCGHIVHVCASLQYLISEHAHYSLINIPEA